MLEPGKYKAKVYDYGVRLSKQNIPMAHVQFQLVDRDEKLNWYGSFSEKAMEFTFNTLKDLGLKGSPSSLKDGFTSKVLNADAVVELVTINETGADGKVWPKIKYINSGNSRVEANPAQTTAVMASMEIDAKYNAYMASKGVQKEEDLGF